MKKLLLQFFTWWQGETIGTRFHTWRFGERVGTDELGNVYYRVAGGKIDKALGFNRRWVIYNGPAEASTIPPGWHGWLHHRVDVPPSDETYVAREWQMAHVPNMTGTPMAYRPPGSLLSHRALPKTDGDYEAWTPGG